MLTSIQPKGLTQQSLTDAHRYHRKMKENVTDKATLATFCPQSLQPTSPHVTNSHSCMVEFKFAVEYR